MISASFFTLLPIRAHTRSQNRQHSVEKYLHFCLTSSSIGFILVAVKNSAKVHKFMLADTHISMSYIQTQSKTSTTDAENSSDLNHQFVLVTSGSVKN